MTIGPATISAVDRATRGRFDHQPDGIPHESHVAQFCRLFRAVRHPDRPGGVDLLGVQYGASSYNFV